MRGWSHLCVLILENENSLRYKVAVKTACAYYRTSSATNVGNDKDSLKRQQDAVRAYASSAGLEVVREYYDAAVSGADPVESREGFSEMLAYMLGNGARTVLVENASRFARDHIVQGLGHLLLKKHGIELIPVDSPGHFLEESPIANMMRTMISAVSQFEKEALVLKLRKARDRKRRESGRCEGNPAFGITPPAHIKAAKAYSAKGVSLRRISVQLAAKGFLIRSDTPYSASAIRSMVMKSIW
jgi:DNA invertase Pin-like site-specific DNA recombinase